MKIIDEAKKLSAAFQNVVLGEKDSDCGTQKYMEYHLTKGNANMFMYRYIRDKNKLVLLTSDNIKDYHDKIIKLRSPLYCTNEQYCNKCAGELYYQMEISNVGILTNRVGTSLLNASLKAFHDMSLKVKRINLDEYMD